MVATVRAPCQHLKGDADMQTVPHKQKNTLPIPLGETLPVDFDLRRYKTCCGVYRIANAMSGKLYIGCSRDVKSRWRSHSSLLRCGAHPVIGLRKESIEYGASAFTFELVELCAPDMLRRKEGEWINRSLKECTAFYNFEEVG